jgi:hypothetical protein
MRVPNAKYAKESLRESRFRNLVEPFIVIGTDPNDLINIQTVCIVDRRCLPMRHSMSSV